MLLVVFLALNKFVFASNYSWGEEEEHPHGSYYARRRGLSTSDRAPKHSGFFTTGTILLFFCCAQLLTALFFVRTWCCETRGMFFGSILPGIWVFSLRRFFFEEANGSTNSTATSKQVDWYFIAQILPASCL